MLLILPTPAALLTLPLIIISVPLLVIFMFSPFEVTLPLILKAPPEDWLCKVKVPSSFVIVPFLAIVKSFERFVILASPLLAIEPPI